MRRYHNVENDVNFLYFCLLSLMLLELRLEKEI
jgi:hypothetical protein